MKITKVSVYQVDLPLKAGSYHWSGGKSVTVLDPTIVAIETDNDLIGWGEVCPRGPFHTPAFAQGVRAGIYELDEVLIGANPVELNKINLNMDIALAGHAYVKSAIDMACWDLLGKHFGQPCTELMGGRFGADGELFQTISLGKTEQMVESVSNYRDQGFRNFHINIGSGDVDNDIAIVQQIAEHRQSGDRLIADANATYINERVRRFCQGVEGIDLYLENLAIDYRQNCTLRSKWDGPVILDESIDSVRSLLVADNDQSLDCFTLKISQCGGLTKAKQFRDLAVELGISILFTDSWGSEITTAAISHLTHSTPPQNRLGATVYDHLNIENLATGLTPASAAGRIAAAKTPGLGIEPRLPVLGGPVYTIE